MVTMSTEKSTCRRRKPAESNGVENSSEQPGARSSDNNEQSTREPEIARDPPQYTSGYAAITCAEDTPNYLVYKKVRKLFHHLPRKKREREKFFFF